MPGRTTEWTVYRRRDTPVYWARRSHRGVAERRSTGHRTRANAEALVRQWNRRAADPYLAAAETATLEDALKRGIELARRNNAPPSVQSKLLHAGHFIRIIGGRTSLASLNTSDIQDYIHERRTSRICPRHACKPFDRATVNECTCQLGVSDSTIAKELCTLREALKAAREAGWIGAAQEAIVPKVKVRYRPRNRWLMPSEAAALIKRVSERFGRHRAAHVCFLLATGARLIESARARREDFNGESVHLRGTKTESSDRDVDITTITLLLFQRAMDDAPNQGLGVLYFTWTNIQRDLKNACKDISIAPVSPNDLRRTFASWHVQQGMPFGDLAGLLGHASTAMVMRVYGRDTAAKRRERIARHGLIPALDSGTGAAQLCTRTTGHGACLQPSAAGRTCT